MDLSSFKTISYENDPVYGMTYIIEPEEWFEKYNEYQIIESNYGTEEWNEIKYRAAKFIQSWWKCKLNKLTQK